MLKSQSDATDLKLSYYSASHAPIPAAPIVILLLAVIQHHPHRILCLGEISWVFLYHLSPGQCQQIHGNALLSAEIKKRGREHGNCS